MHLPLTVITVSDGKKPGEDILSQATEILKGYDITHDNMLESGDAVDAILGFCRKGSYDLLVIGAYGHSKIRELILGNTTVQLMRKVTCPVLLCR